MSNFHVGQKVVCIGPSYGGEQWVDCTQGEICPVKGNVYTIRGFHPSGNSIYLVEIVNPPRSYTRGFVECSFGVACFRPVAEKPDAIEQFRKMCRDAEAGKLVDA